MNEAAVAAAAAVLGGSSNRLFKLKKDQQIHDELIAKYNEIGKMLGGMAENPQKFVPK